ncbi:MAG: DUF2059 domain-containing protein [Pseudomonadota bacterium]
MKLRIFAAVWLLAFPAASFADEPTETYKALVDEILEVTGALKIGEQMADLVVQQMIMAMKAGGTELPDRMLDVMREEAVATISREMAAGSFNEMMYPIYAKYLDEKDLRAAIAFYSTEEGRKFAEAAPLMAMDGMTVGQKWGAMLGPRIARNVERRLREEGIEL